MTIKASSTVVGALACQRDSFLKTLKTTVVSCDEHKGHVTAKDKQNKNSKKQSDPKDLKYAIQLADTIIFPEGGGQPSDTGIIENGQDKWTVDEVIRDKLTALHLTSAPITPGIQVDLQVDWARRFDHMQQHTGQHLLSAIFDQYNLGTLSWSLGEMINYIELPQKVDDSTIQQVSEKVNQAIIDCIDITVETPDIKGDDVDISHLPEDYDLSKGILRIVKIGDLDRNPCCGTHLANTSQIQAVTILHQVNVKGGNSRLYFTCGSRVPKLLAKHHEILKNVSGNILSCQVDEVYDKTKLLNDNYRESNSNKSNLLKELVAIEAKQVFETLKSKESGVDYFYRKDSNPEAITLFQKELLTLINSNKDSGVDLEKSHTIVMFNGQKDGGMIKVMGPEATKIQDEAKNLITNLKGGGKGNSFQGKISSYEKGEISSLTTFLDSLKI